MKKLTLTMLSVIFAFCLALSMSLALTSANSAKADAGTTPNISETKYMISNDSQGMLIATGINNYEDVYSIGYIFTDGEGEEINVSTVTTPTQIYYTSIIRGTEVDEVEELFGAEYTGMIVWEINYDLASEYNFKAYACVGERINGALYETDDVVYSQSRTVSAGVYQITFKNADGTILQQSSVATGTLPAYNGETPTMQADAQYTYGEFTGWDSAISEVTGEKVYTATYNNKQVNEYTVSVQVNNAEFGSVSQSSIANVPYGTAIVVDGAEITVNGTTVTATATDEKYFFIDWACAVESVNGNVTVTANFGEKYNLNGKISMHRNAENTLIAENTDLALYNGEDLVKSIKVGANGEFDFGAIVEGNYKIKLANAKEYAVELTEDKEEMNVVVEYDMFTAVSTYDIANANNGTIEMTSAGKDLVFNQTSANFYVEFVYKMRANDTTASGKDARWFFKFDGNYGVRVTESADSPKAIAFCEWADDYEVSWTGYSFNADEIAKIKGDGLKIAIIRLDGVIYVYTASASNGLLNYRMKTTAKGANDGYMFYGWQPYELTGLRYIENFSSKQIEAFGTGTYKYHTSYEEIKNGSIVNMGSNFKPFLTQYKNFVAEFDYNLYNDVASSSAYFRFFFSFMHNDKRYEFKMVDSYSSQTVGRIGFFDEGASTGYTSDNVSAGTRYVFSDAEKEALKTTGNGIHIKIQRIDGVISLFINGTKRIEVTLPAGYENDQVGMYGSSPIAELQNFTYTEIK